ncbi:hypothetical protein NCAS_0E01300 [Naumovozyma castellii]|uniref:Palmitoyltransferase n=1 Tax=Naumovozyma castellii TaxID=27288 RepID=G0VFD4_NAUCA|nr:hypothetical protein NCAS_0E01300 [Naumovozyma castellii CBS 4309]CCC70200.1 hypothetical protein NCAS_0E01300 [Naumovozyma castellii CBS 4309]
MITTLFPRCLTTSIYIWTAYVTILHVNTIPSILVLTPILILATIGIFAYFRVVSTGPGTPSNFPDLRVYNLEDAKRGIELPPEYIAKRSFTLKKDGRYRLCQTCQVWKPDRCHHCSTCDKCILKMDHHCPWFAECIGFENQKYFVQFLIYCTAYSIVVLFFTSCELHYWFSGKQYEDELIDLMLLTVWILAIVITVSLIFFSSFSIYQLLKNQTTIEMYGMKREKRDLELLRGLEDAEVDNIFDLGSRRRNWESVMGESYMEWIFPIMTYRRVRNKHSKDEHGLYFDIRMDNRNHLLESADLQNRLLRRVTPRPSMETTEPLTNSFD